MKLNCRSATAYGRAICLFASISSRGRFFLFQALSFLLLLASAGESAAATTNLTSQIEYLGNPFAARYSGSSAPARSVTRMRLFNNRIYLGHGNTSVSGPTDLWAFDLGQDAFVKEGALFEQLIDQIRVFGSSLYMNGRDSMGQGAMYRVDPVQGLQMLNIAEDGHYFDIYKFDGKIFSNVGVNTHPWPRLAISSDDGGSFQIPAPASGAAYASSSNSVGQEFMEFNGHLYRSTLFDSDKTHPPPFITKYTGNDSDPMSAVHLTFADFYGDGTTGATPLNFTQVDSGLAIFTALGNLYSTTNIESPQSAFREVGEPAGLPKGDNVTLGTGCVGIRKIDGTFYIAYNFTNSGAYWTAVCQSITGTNWTETFRFTIGSRVRSFERADNGDYYFGAFGTLFSQGEAAIPGNIYRIRAGSISATPPAFVTLSADRLSIFKGSGTNLALRIRRSGPTNAPMTVNYTVAGTAIAGTDYSTLSSSAIIPAGSWSVDVPIVDSNNPLPTGARTIIVTLSENAAYTIAAPSTLTFTISDQTAGGTALPLNGLTLWLKADQGVTTNPDGTVSAWADQSGHNHHASQTAPTKQPKFVASGPNNRPAIVFDGVNDWLNVGSLYAQAYYTAIVFSNKTVIATTTPTQSLLNYTSFAEGGGSGLELGSAQVDLVSEIFGIYYQAYTNATVGFSLPSAPHSIVLSQPQHAQPFTFQLDGVDKLNTNPNPLKIITPDCEAVKIGTSDGTNKWFNGSISEIIIYNRPLTAAEATNVANYLQRYFAANRNPVALPDVVTRAPGAFIDLPAPPLAANDTDEDGDLLTIVSVGTPLPPGATLNFDGSTIRYSPPANSNATGSFTYQVSDGRGGVATGTVTVNVSNHPPVAVNDSFDREPAHDLILPLTSLTSNDTDPDFDPLTVLSATQPLAAGASVAIEGSNFHYYPPPGSNAADQFSYTISDGRGYTASAQVTVTVANQAPVDGEDFRTTNVGQPLGIPIPALDTEGDAISVAAFDPRSAAHGTIRFSTATHQLIYIPPSGFSGPDSFHYTILDARGRSASVTVQITVVVANQPPTPAPHTFNRTPNKPITLQFSQILAGGSDPDGATDLPLSIIAVMGRTPAGAKIVMSSTYLTYTAPPGFNGTDTFSYTVRDKRGAMATATVTILGGVASPLIAPDFSNDVDLNAALIDSGKVALRGMTVPGTVLQIDASEDATVDWLPLCRIRTGQDGIAYLETDHAGKGRFFRASAVDR